MESGQQNIRIGHILSSNARGIQDPNAPVASAFAVQNRAKNRWTVEFWPAEPVNRTFAGNQGRRAAVADDSVILDFRAFCRHGKAKGSLGAQYKQCHSPMGE